MYDSRAAPVLMKPAVMDQDYLSSIRRPAFLAGKCRKRSLQYISSYQIPGDWRTLPRAGCIGLPGVAEPQRLVYAVGHHLLTSPCFSSCR